MPYPNEHSARLREPRDFDPDTFRRTKGGTIYVKIKVPTTISIIWGKLKGKAANLLIPQALRFPTKNWTVTEAKKWLKDSNIKYIKFEAATKKKDAIMKTDMVVEVLVDSEKMSFTRNSLQSWFKDNADEDGVIKKSIEFFEHTYYENDTGEFIMSDGNLNRLGMKINPEGWIIKNYRKNPVLLWSHSHSIPSIGKMKKVRIEDDALRGLPEYDSDDPFAVSIERKVENGYLSSGSTGFKVLEIEFVEPKNDDDDIILLSKKQELYEFSICNVPALPTALIDRKKKKNSLQDSTPENEYIEDILKDKHERLSIFDESRDTSGFQKLFKTSQGE